jgi:hypothetical protein
MESALNPLEEHLTCDLCRQALRERIKNLIVQWSVVKVSGSVSAKCCILVGATTEDCVMIHGACSVSIISMRITLWIR